MQFICEIRLSDGRTLAANIRAAGADSAWRKCDFLAFDWAERYSAEVCARKLRHNIRAPKFGFTTVNTKTGRIAGAKPFELIYTAEART